MKQTVTKCRTLYSDELPKILANQNQMYNGVGLNWN